MSRTTPTEVGRYLVIAGMVATGLAIVAALAFVSLDGGPTTTAGLVYGLHDQLLVVAVTLAVMVEAVLVYVVWRFRDNEDRTPTPENRKLELAWTLATGLVLVFVGVTSYQVLAHPDVTAAAGPAAGEDVLEVDMTAHQWYWSVSYPGNVSIERADRIVLPADRPIRIRVTSEDVIHSFHVPRLGLKQDAIPGQRNVVSTRITETGEYRLYCAEYCGRGHATMQATIEVVDEEAYDDWLTSRRNGSSTP